MRSESLKDILIKFGLHLQNLRAKQNLSLRALSLKCNLDHSVIKKIENGDRNLSLISLTELANGLDIPLKELLDF